MTEQDKPKIASLLDDHDPDISSLYKESAQDMPPTSLDDKILRAAHAAVTSQEEAPVVHKPRRPWPLLGGLAASVLVAVLAVKLLPHSLQAPAPASKQRTAVESSEADQLAPESAAPPTASVSTPMPTSSAALPETRIQQISAPPNIADEREKKAERTFSAGALSDRADKPMQKAASELSGKIPAAAPIEREDEFKRIVALWQSGHTLEAITRFEVFQKQHPDYTPSEADRPVFQTLLSALETKNQPQKTGIE